MANPVILGCALDGLCVDVGESQETFFFDWKQRPDVGFGIRKVGQGTSVAWVVDETAVCRSRQVEAVRLFSWLGQASI
jgi:hypothetical protein